MPALQPFSINSGPGANKLASGCQLAIIQRCTYSSSWNYQHQPASSQPSLHLVEAYREQRSSHKPRPQHPKQSQFLGKDEIAVALSQQLRQGKSQGDAGGKGGQMLEQLAVMMYQQSQTLEEVRNLAAEFATVAETQSTMINQLRVELQEFKEKAAMAGPRPPPPLFPPGIPSSQATTSRQQPGPSYGLASMSESQQSSLGLPSEQIREGATPLVRDSIAATTRVQPTLPSPPAVSARLDEAPGKGVPSWKCRKAVLIDADGMQLKNYYRMEKEIRKHGKVVSRTAYGLQQSIMAWADANLFLTFEIVAKMPGTRQKNAADQMLIADAMHAVDTKAVDVLCLYIVDGGYSDLCEYAVERGVQVQVFGPIAGAHNTILKLCTSYFDVDSSQWRQDLKKPNDILVALREMIDKQNPGTGGKISLRDFKKFMQVNYPSRSIEYFGPGKNIMAQLKTYPQLRVVDGQIMFRPV